MINAIKNLSIIIPCLNEAEVIPALLPRVIKSLEDLKKQNKISDFELTVVNDQSTDNSLNLLSEYKTINVVNTVNKKRGYGSALKSGFSHAKGDWIGFFDLDNSYRPEDLKLFVDEILKGESDFIMGSREFNEKGMSLTRGFGNWLYKSLANLLYGAKLNDVCSGYRVFHRKYIPEILEISEEGLNFSIQLTLNMVMQKILIKQISITYDERLGESKLSVLKDGFSFLKVLLTFKLRRLNAFKHSRV